MYYSLVLCSTILIALDFSLSKKYQTKEGTALSSGLKYNAIAGLFSALIAFGLCGFRVEFSWFSLVMAIAAAVCNAGYILIGFQVLKAGNVAVYSIFLMSSGMLLPYVFGLCFLNETVNFFRVVGILLILIATILSNRFTKPLTSKQLALCVCIFVLNGLMSIVSKCHQVGLAYSPVDSTAFVIYNSGAKAVLCLAALLFIPQKTGFSFRSKTSPLFAILSGAVGCIGFLFLLIGAAKLPATVIYPMVSGGSIIFSALFGLLFFRENSPVFSGLALRYPSSEHCVFYKKTADFCPQLLLFNVVS